MGLNQQIKEPRAPASLQFPRLELNSFNLVSHAHHGAPSSFHVEINKTDKSKMKGLALFSLIQSLLVTGVFMCPSLCLLWRCVSTVSQHFANNVQATGIGSINSKGSWPLLSGLHRPAWWDKARTRLWPTDCRVWDVPRQMGSHFQIFPELEDKCTWPEANEVGLIFVMLFFMLSRLIWMCLGLNWLTLLGKLHGIAPLEADFGVKQICISTHLGAFMFRQLQTSYCCWWLSEPESPSEAFFKFLCNFIFGPIGFRVHPWVYMYIACVFDCASSDYIHFCSQSVPKSSLWLFLSPSSPVIKTFCDPAVQWGL